MPNVSFTAPPTIARFMMSEAFVRIILGPVGSGKSTGCLMEILRRSREQKAGPDGIRRTRWTIVRQTLQQIKQTVLKEFYTWIAPVTQFKVSENTIYIQFEDVYMEIHLIPLEDGDDQKRLLSMQLTGAWVNEFPEIDPNIIPSLCGRLGRFPSAAQGGPTWFGLLMDGNFPDEGGEWHKLLETERPPDWDVYKQPGGLTPDAENLENLPGKRLYYERLAANNKASWVKRYVDAEYGDDPSGTAVFADSFKRSFHVKDSLEPLRGHPLLIGQDFGRDPCSLICQLDNIGRFNVLEEVIAEDIGLEQHITMNLRPRLMNPRYMGFPIAMIGDPAGNAKDSIYEETSFDALKRLGFMAFPAPTNDLDPRIRAVEAFLLGQRGGGPALQIDYSRCPALVLALNGGYRYGKTKAGQRKPTPDKNRYSHIVDALQYPALVAHGGMVEHLITRKLKRPTKSDRPRITAAAWT